MSQPAPWTRDRVDLYPDKAIREIEQLRVERAQAHARVDYFVKLMARFWKATPDDIKAPDGRTFQFVDPDPQRTLRIIRDGMNEAMAQTEMRGADETSPPVHALVLEKAIEIGRLRAVLRRIELLSQTFISKNGIEITTIAAAALDGSPEPTSREHP